MRNQLTYFNMQTGRFEVDEAVFLKLVGDNYTGERLILRGPVMIGRSKNIAKTWWGQRWINSIEHDVPPTIVNNARSMARNGGILGVYMRAGLIAGLISNPYGYYQEPCVARITLPTFGEEQWTRAANVITAKARRVAALLNMRVPDDLEAVLDEQGVPLFDFSGFSYERTCNERLLPCTHTLAMSYAVAEQLDANPLILFLLRGWQIQTALAQLRGEPPPAPAAPQTAPDPASEFWIGSSPPFTPPLKPFSPNLSVFAPNIAQELTLFYAKMSGAAEVLREGEHTLTIDRVALSVPTFDDMLPPELDEKYRAITAQLEPICAQHLTPEHTTVALRMTRALMHSSLSPLKGRPVIWAAGILYTVERLNPDSIQHDSSTIGGWFRVAGQTVELRARGILSALKATPNDPRWSLTPQESIWSHLVRVNGVVVDRRTLSPELQAAVDKQLATTPPQTPRA